MVYNQYRHYVLSKNARIQVVNYKESTLASGQMIKKKQQLFAATQHFLEVMARRIIARLWLPGVFVRGLSSQRHLGNESCTQSHNFSASRHWVREMLKSVSGGRLRVQRIVLYVDPKCAVQSAFQKIERRTLISFDILANQCIIQFVHFSQVVDKALSV